MPFGLAKMPLAGFSLLTNQSATTPIKTQKSRPTPCGISRLFEA
jgi:hypothetical protein